MKTYPHFLFLGLIGVSALFQGCARNSDDVWEDTKSCGRHISRGALALTGCHGDSRQIRCRSDFEGIDDVVCYEDGSYQDEGYQDCCEMPPSYDYQEPAQPVYDFVPLQDQANEIAMGDCFSRQPRETPGEMGSSIPGIQAFRDPSTIPQLAGIFRTIYFEYNSNLIKGQSNLQALHQIADYLRTHPNVYVFIEGHTDERGPEKYNYELGARRSNAVRNQLISEGVNPDNLFTVTYGKDRPVVMESHEEGWSKNRRAEFKVYAR